MITPVTTPPLFIFDLDNTLADMNHRWHYIRGPNQQCYDGYGEARTWGPCQCATCTGWKEDRESFYRACTEDTPIKPVLKVLDMLLSQMADVWIFSGRSAIVRPQTEAWLIEHTILSSSELKRNLYMRRHGDDTKDDELKEAWLLAMSPYDRERLVAAFEDRDRVVAMWRRNNVQCFQVQSGNF